MEFRIADTFTDSLARLTGKEQKAVKTTAFDLQLNPANPGMSFHKLEKAKDKNFWSVRVSSDIRLIVHRSAASFLLCYVGRHDDAYNWAERRKLEQHPVTRAAQLVEIRETVKEVVVPVYVDREVANESRPLTQKKPLFAGTSDGELLGHGVPADWLGDVRNITSEDGLLALTDHLPAEASEALLELATGGKPRRSAMPNLSFQTAFDHPDAQRRFRVMKDMEELQRALDFPWEKWTIFLHPDQRQWVERDYTGPARVSGSAGTGKTIVALHRSTYLARAYPATRLLLTTFSDTPANVLRSKPNRLIGNKPRLAERIDVYSLDAIGNRLYKAHIGPRTIASNETIRELVRKAGGAVGGHKFSLHFLVTEWEQVVDAWQLENWEGYRDVARLGRKTRLREAQRKVLWSIFRPGAGGVEKAQANHARRGGEGVEAAGERERRSRTDYASSNSSPSNIRNHNCIRMLFDWLVTGQVIPSNPAQSVRGPCHFGEQGYNVGALFRRSNGAACGHGCFKPRGTARPRHHRGDDLYVRPRQAVVALAVEDHLAQKKRWWLRLRKKNGKVNEMPCYHRLESQLDAYIEVAGIAGDRKGPLFRAAVGKTKKLGLGALSRTHVWYMVHRRAADAGIETAIGCHTFRATGITDYPTIRRVHRGRTAHGRSLERENHRTL